MRNSVLSLLAIALLAGCYATGDGSDGSWGAAETPQAGGWGAPAATPAETLARVDNWEAQWAEARREVTVARAEAVAAGTPPAPQVDAEVTELLERDLTSPDPDVRIEQLQDAVSDALRLAELVSIG